MEETKREAETSLSKFSYALDQLEQTLRPVLKAIDELRASGNEDDLDAMSRARMHISLCYSVNALFCMYLRTQGVDPATHPVSEDIARVQEAFMRMRRVEAGLSVHHQPAPDRERRRHYVNAKKAAQKLAALVFPEEVDLLNAMRGKKRKRKTARNGKAKKAKTEQEAYTSESDSSDEDDDTISRESGQSEGDALQSGRAREDILLDTKQSEHVNKNRGATRVHDSTDSTSEEEHGGEVRKAAAKQVQEKTKSAEEKISAKKKKKKEKNESNNKDSTVDSEKKRSKDKSSKKDKKDRTPKQSRHSEVKRKRKKKTGDKRHSKLED